MKMTARINQLLAPMGVRLQRIPESPTLSQAPSRTAGHHVELIGPSGVGKSYFYAQLSLQLTADWLSRMQISQISQYSIHRRDSFKELEGKDSTLVEYLLRMKHEFIWNQDMPLYHKHWIYTYFAKQMGNDGFARDLCLPTRSVFLDEGVQHIFTRELLTWHSLRATNSAEDMQRLKDYMKGRSLILLDASVEHIMGNLKKRHAQSQGQQLNDWLAFMSEEDILANIRYEKASKKRWARVAKALGAATLELDASEELSANERKVAKFLESIQRGQGGGNKLDDGYYARQ
ncbi:MAG TPA: hypothetical protein VLO13_03520 [Halomonas sp.]|nr:hypothetical protein [Halomonas sp.]